MKLLKPDFVPRLADQGLDDIILGAFNHQTDINGLRMAINRKHPELNLDNDELLHYIAERGGLGLTLTGAGHPPATPRPDAPKKLTQNSRSVSFTGEGKEVARWYVNGKLAAITTSSSRMVKADLRASPGDVVQVAIVDDGVVGWWARVRME